MTWLADIKTFSIDRWTSASFKCMWILFLTTFFFFYAYLYNPTVRRLEALPGGGGSYVACLNFKTSRVGVYKCLSLIVSFTVTVVIGRGRLSLVAISFYALSLVFGPCRLSEFTLVGPQVSLNSPGEKKPTLSYFREGAPAHQVHFTGDAQLGFEFMSLKCETCRRKEKSEKNAKNARSYSFSSKKSAGEHKFLLLIWSSYKHLIQSSWINWDIASFFRWACLTSTDGNSILCTHIWQCTVARMFATNLNPILIGHPLQRVCIKLEN